MEQDSNTLPGDSDRRPSLAEKAREPVAANRRGVLSTLIPDGGAPYGSLVDLAPLPGGEVIMFLSTLAEHQHYLAADPRASIFIASGFTEVDALAQARVTLVGRVAPVEDRESVVWHIIPMPGDISPFQTSNFTGCRWKRCVSSPVLTEWVGSAAIGTGRLP
jgi:hypothetical protein